MLNAENLCVESVMKRSILLLILQLTLCTLLVSGCASQGLKTSDDLTVYFHDEYFSPAQELPDADTLFELPEDALNSLRRELTRSKGYQHQSKVMLHEWLANYINAADGGFRYADNVTRSARDTFDDREGNCLSLVVLTAALAKELAVKVEFQEIDIPPVWDRQGGFYLVNGHINLKLLPQDKGNVFNISTQSIQIDFLPERAMQGYQKRRVSRAIVVSMFYNNIAAEALVEGNYDRAYGLLKLALKQEELFLPALNTLAVLYRYKGLDQQAEVLYKYVLSVQPEDMNALNNYAIMLSAQDRLDEWSDVHKVMELARIRNPYYYYGMAQQAYFDKEYQDALIWYKRAIAKADYRHEFYFGLSRTYWVTGDLSRAEQSLEKALKLTTDEHNKRRYQAKLHAMRSH
ncbi:Tetratricopeptide TPR_2 repeat protein [Shewanella pealeana ATCC 700345]|uniref:Tetratricopeptide TPR_2 repeat protein n=2 Tax=Shewanella pealeana TaxID=70864 RepID=A8H0S6_SHEPA|nr:Tetratricopeptide TPR_2 repeat protein [Shewanella pealeana ATCC 700345]